jgi:apolipoprotein D and lipocalin family protein
MKRRIMEILGWLTGTAVAGCSPGGVARLETVPHVDLQRYTGTWYEIARYPNRFEKGCVAATAEYTALPDGRIRVVNSCRQGALDGPARSVRGTARVVDRETNARLKVSFFWPFEGDYWIIDLDPGYGWAVIGEPRRRYLWILSRTPALEEPVLQSILDRLPRWGYAADRLERPPQPVPG